MAKSVKGRVLIKNHVQLLDVVHFEQVPTENFSIEGLFWLVPVMVGGVFSYYKPVIEPVKPTLDSVNSVRVKDKNTGFIYYVALGDAATADDFAAAAAKCCADTTVEMPAVTVPKRYAERALCLNAAGTYELSVVVPVLPAGKNYKVYGSKNGVAIAPDLYANNYASVAAIVAALTASWAAAGTFVAAGQKITWTTATGDSGSLNIDIA